MWRHVKNRKGQQIVEYLIIVAAVIAGVIFAATLFKTHIDTLLKNSNTKVENSGAALKNQSVETVPGS